MAAIPANRGHGRSHKPPEAVGRGPAPDGFSPKIKSRRGRDPDLQRPSGAWPDLRHSRAMSDSSLG